MAKEPGKKKLAGKSKVLQIKRAKIDRPSTVDRLDIPKSGIKELAENIRENGLLQAILVVENKGRYEIVAGDRRFAAMTSLGWDEIPCTIFEGNKTQVAFARASENLSRENLTPIEEANIYHNLHENHGLSFEEIGKRIGKSAGVVRRRVEMVRMPPCLKEAVHEKKISQTVAEELWMMADMPAITYYLEFCIDHGATQAVARQWRKDYQDTKRREERGTQKELPLSSPVEKKPYYVACDICQDPMEIGDESVVRACPDCVENVIKVIAEMEKRKK